MTSKSKGEDFKISHPITHQITLCKEVVSMAELVGSLQWETITSPWSQWVGWGSKIKSSSS